LPREALPTQWLTDADVWAALLPNLGLTALIRNLGNLSRCRLLAAGNREVVSEVTLRITSKELLRKARVHPIAILAALMTYQAGKGVRGDGTWTVVSQVVDALDSAFYGAFGNVQPSGKRLVLALDVSGSMARGMIAGTPGLTPRVGSAAMALVTAATERTYNIIAFSRTMVHIDITPRQRLDDVVRAVSSLEFGGTDCALPMLWALESRVDADAFVILTDNETWAGAIHPAQALQNYRVQTGIPAKLIVVGMTSSGFSIADPDDAGMLDCVGFDTATPQVISDFAADR
ncbi:MAG TPA: TROVE domain-containing protein, partial [Aggregatilineales bacterium]|nr:TROVE domain-containing protein [Aggregatilineales bacterium]